MKRIFFCFLFFIATATQAQLLVMNDETTDVTFVTKFLAGRLEGSFKGVNGSSAFDPNNLDKSYLKMVFLVATVTTNENQFAPNLIQPECFYPSKYPFIELFSTSITRASSPNSYNFFGQLKIKGITKNVTIPFTAVPNAGGYDFAFGFGFLRKTFGLTCTGIGKEFKVNVRAYTKKM